MAGKLYRYEAVDQQGEPVNGSMEEISAERVTTILSERGLQVNHVESQDAEGFSRRGRGKLSWEEISQFNEHLVAITKSGMPIAPSLKAVSHDLQRGSLRSAVESIGKSLDAGMSLEDALESNGAQFPSVYRSMIRAGERTGNLPGVLDMMARHSTRMLDLKAQVIATMTYPVIAFTIAFFIVVFMLVEVVPVFSDIFGEFGAALPAPTEFLLDISYVVDNHLGATLAVVIGACVSCIAAYVATRSTISGRALLDALAESLPFVGKSFHVASVARFSRSLGLMLKSEVPLLESLDLAATSSNNLVLKRHVDAAAVQVARGEKVADALSDTGYFPHAFCWFIANGESFGTLPDTLITVSDSYEQSVTNNDKVALNLLAPALVLTLALVVGYIVMALYMPIFTLGDAISG